MSQDGRPPQQYDAGSTSLPHREEGASPKSIEDIKDTFRRTIDAFNQRNLALVTVLFAADYVYHSAPPGTPAGPAGVQQIWQGAFATLPDITTSIEDQVAEGDKVVARSTNCFTHATEFMGCPPTGRPVAFGVIEIARFADGQWVESWSVPDMLGMLQQLGAVPTASG